MTADKRKAALSFLQKNPVIISKDGNVWTEFQGDIYPHLETIRAALSAPQQEAVTDLFAALKIAVQRIDPTENDANKLAYVNGVNTLAKYRITRGGEGE